MMQGQFTKEEADEVMKSLLEIGEGMTKKQLREFFGHFNDIALFVSAAKAVAPHEPDSINLQE